MDNIHDISSAYLAPTTVYHVTTHSTLLAVSKAAKEKVHAGKAYLDNKIKAPYKRHEQGRYPFRCATQVHGVRMGANATTKAYQMVEKTCAILPIEPMATSQVLVFRGPLKTRSPLKGSMSGIKVPFIQENRLLYTDIENATSFLKEIN